MSICPGLDRGASSERTHAGIDLIPAEYAHLPAIAFIRNPWDWYVSWYHWETQYLGSGERPEPQSDTHPGRRCWAAAPTTCGER